MDEFENREGYPHQTQSQTDYYSYGQNQNTNTYQGEAAWYKPYEEPKPVKKKSGFGKKLVKCMVVALVFGVVGGTAFAGTTQFFDGLLVGREQEPAKEENLSGGNLNIAEDTEAIDDISYTTGEKSQLSASGAVTDVSDIVDQAMPSIVSITTIARTQVPSFFFGQMEEYESEGCGSGIIISQDDENLYIATNNHVVEGAETLTVVFTDDSSVDAKIKGADPSSDLAVVSVALKDIEKETKEKIREATFGDSLNLKVGQTAIAIGNALGYGQSVTTGVISALDREVSVSNENDGSTVTNALLQTDAAINPGNSGGALLNLKGEVIGINSVKYSETSVEGMGYAIPTKTAIPIIQQLITREKVTEAESGYLGISGVDVTQSVSDTYQMPRGVYVAQVVEGSGAANAGIIQGDIITGFDGRNITSMQEVQDLLQYLSAGSTVEVTVQRAENGEYTEQTVEVILGSKR